MFYADNQLQLWNTSLEEAADLFQDLNVTADDFAGVDSYIIADTILGGALPDRHSAVSCTPDQRCLHALCKAAA